MTTLPEQTSATYRAHGLSSRCAANLPHTPHLCLGISPFNGYYTVPRINSLVAWAAQNFERFHIFVPDELPAYTFGALGYSPADAKAKARKQARYLLNKIRGALALAGYEGRRDLILDAEALRDNARYQELLAQAHTHFGACPQFRAEVLSTSGWILEQYLPAGQQATPEQELLAAQYFLGELPLFVDTPGIAGISSASAFAYHQEVDFLRRFYGRELSWQPVDGQHFAVVVDGNVSAQAAD